MDEQGVGGGTPPTDGGGRNDGTAPGARHGRTRRAVLIGTGAAAAGVIGWGISRLSDEDDSKPSEESTTPMPKGPCLVEREFPDSFSSSLEVLDAAPLEATVLGTPFTQVSLQDVIALMGTDERERLVITQHGATAQIQLVPLDGDSEPVVHDVAVGVNPGVAQGAGVVWFVTREDGRVLSVGPDPDVMTDRGRVSEEATSLYSPVIGPGGEVFGGSYPIGAVWRLDPATDEISVGPGIDGNRYVRSLAVVGDRLFAGTGGDSPGLYEIDQGTLEPIASYAVPGVRSGGSVSRLVALPGGTLLVYRDEEDGGADGVIFTPESGVFDDELSPGASSRSFAPDSTGDGVFFVAADRVQWLDASTLEVRDAGESPIANPTAVVALASGTVAAVAPGEPGSGAMILAPLSGGGDPLELPVTPSAHDITSVIPLAATQQIAIGGYQADGVVVVGRDGSEVARTEDGSGVQQVEGGIESGEGTFLVGSYGEGRVHSVTVVPDEKQLTTQEITDLGTTLQQSRPIAWARFEDGIAVGTAPEQGRIGGAIQVIALEGDAPTADGTVDDPADGRSVVGIIDTGEGEAIVTTSVRGGYGAEAGAETAVVLRIALPGGEVAWSASVEALDVYSPLVQNGRIFCATTDGIVVLDLESGEVLAHTVFGEAAATGGYTAARLEPWQAQGRFLHVARGRLRLVDMVEGTVAPGSDGVGSPLTLMGDRLYAASGAELIEFALPEDPDLAACAS